MKTLSFGLLLTSLTFALAVQAGPPGDPFPVKVDMSVQWNIRLLTPQQQCGPSAPWYGYFPYDCHFQCAAPTGLYPNWPQPMPAATQEGQQKTGGIQSSVSNYLQPTGLNRPQGPSYWYQQ